MRVLCYFRVMKTVLLIFALFLTKNVFADPGFLPEKAVLRSTVDTIAKKIEASCSVKGRTMNHVEGCKYLVVSQLYTRAFPKMLQNRNICKIMSLDSQKLCYSNDIMDYDLWIQYRSLDRDFADVKVGYCFGEVGCVDTNSRTVAKSLRNAVGTYYKATIQNKQLVKILARSKTSPSK